MALLSDDDVFGAQKPTGLLSDDDVFGTASQDNPLTRGYKHAVSSAKTAKAMVTGDYQEAARLASERDTYAKRNPGSKEGNELMQAWGAGDGVSGGIKNVAGEFAKDWKESPSTFDAVRATGKNLLAMGGGIVEQVPNMVMPMAGMIAGGAAGGASPIPGGMVAGSVAGATLGNAATESAEQVDRSLRDAGIDPQDTGAVQAYLEQNGGKIVGQTLTKGAVLGAVDTATAGLAHRLLTAPAKAATRRTLAGMGVDVADKAAVKTAMESAEFGTRIANDAAYQATQKGVNKAARNAGAFAMEPAGEFAGEYFGQGLATGDWDTKGAALEALSSLGQSGITFAGQKFIEYVTRPKSGTSTDAPTEPPAGSLLALPSPTYTGTPSDQVLQGQVERQRMIDEADANAQAVYEARAAFEAAQRELNAIQLTTDPEPLQQRIDELLGIGRKPLPKGEQAAYEKALADALNEPVGITHDANGREIPLTMGAYLDARTEAADKQRMLDAAETMTAAGEAAQARLSQVQDEESTSQPEIPVVGPLSAAAKQAVDSGVAANIQARKALEEASNPLDGGEKNGNQSRQPANAEMATPGAQGAGSNLPGGGSILAPASAGNAGTGVNRAEVATSGVRPAVPAGTSVDAGLVRSYQIGQATMMANRLTRQGMPSEIYPHPTQAGMFAIRPQGQPAAESVEQPSPPAVPATQRNSARRMTPIMRRDDLVGAIMRVTGGNGIAASMADTLTGEKANAATKLRGLFTSQGQADMDDLAMLLREEEGFDVRDASHLEDLIREAAAGNVARSMARQERDAQEDQDKQYRDQIRARAKKYGIKTVAVKFSELEKIVLQRLEDRHNQAVAQLDDRSQQRFNTALEEAMALVPEDVVDETLADVNQRGLRAREFWNEATRILRGMIYDAKQEASNETEQPAEEIGDGRRNSGTGRGTPADQRDQAPSGQAGERAAEPAEEERPGLTLQGQTPEEVRAQEAQRQAEEARANRPEPDTSPRVRADQVDLFNTQGGLFSSNRDAQSATADLPRVDAVSAPVASTEQVQPNSIDTAAHEAATSPQNDTPEPSQAQKEAGNYKVGRVKIAGLDISIENPEGSTRSGTDPNGKPWSITMQSHYGYIRKTEGRDGDHVDVFVKPGTIEDYAGQVFVIDQRKANGHFDEHKVMLGWPNEEEAKAAYLANYSKGWTGLGAITPMPMEQFKAWVDTGDQTQPIIDPESGYSETGFSTFTHPIFGDQLANTFMMYQNREPRFYINVLWRGCVWHSGGERKGRWLLLILTISNG